MVSHDPDESGSAVDSDEVAESVASDRNEHSAPDDRCVSVKPHSLTRGLYITGCIVPAVPTTVVRDR
jgi:hypothetical protein